MRNVNAVARLGESPCNPVSWVQIFRNSESFPRNRPKTCAGVVAALETAGHKMCTASVRAKHTMPPKTTGRDPYLVKSVVHSSQLLGAFRTSGEALPLREISARSGLPKSMAFRLLYTLERCGM